MRQSLIAANLEAGEVDRILMVGGSTRIPAVTEMLAELFGQAPEVSLAADEAVVHGAALRAAQILERTQGKPQAFSIRNVNSHSLGVVALELQTGRERSAVLIPRNTPLPAQVKRTFTTKSDGQRTVLVPIVEGESSAAEHCTSIGTCVISDLPSNLPAGSPVDVTFRYDTSGRLAITAAVSGTDAQASQEIHRPNGLSAEDLGRWRKWVAERIPQ